MKLSPEWLNHRVIPDNVQNQIRINFEIFKTKSGSKFAVLEEIWTVHFVSKHISLFI